MSQLNRIFAPLPTTERGKSVALGRDPKLKNFIYAAGSGIVIRDIKVTPRLLHLGRQPHGYRGSVGARATFFFSAATLRARASAVCSDGRAGACQRRPARGAARRAYERRAAVRVVLQMR